MTSSTKWEPLSFLGSEPTEPFSLIVLNQPILIKKEVMVDLWNKAAYRITVDGGTDRWLEWLEGSGVCGVKNLGLPDLVSGDLDSIQHSTINMMLEKSVCIQETQDQNYTDFCKAVKCIRVKNAPKLIVTICEVSGRLDQILSQLNTLHMHEEHIFLISSCSATWLLRPGSHEINVSHLKNNELLSQDRWIGLLPVGAPTNVTTSGLKYNLDNTEMKFGGLVSSSNTYSEDPIIKVKADQPLIWSMGLSLADK